MNVSTFGRRAITMACRRYRDAATYGALDDSYESLRDIVALALALDESVTCDCTILDVLGLSEDEYGTPDAVLTAIDAATPDALRVAGF
jgi:hypothetical protein